MIYKLKLNVWSENEEINDDTEWCDFYLDVNYIIGFRVYKYTCTEKEEKASFIYIEGDVFLIKNEPHIMKYLLDNFVNKVVKS